MSEYIPFDISDQCTECASTETSSAEETSWVTPKVAILTLTLLLNHDERDMHKPGIWVEFDEDDDEICPACREVLAGVVIETSCLHRYHYDCIMHGVIVHRRRFCYDETCRMRIF